jgi:hypothetical protein
VKCNKPIKHPIRNKTKQLFDYTYNQHNKFLVLPCQQHICHSCLNYNYNNNNNNNNSAQASFLLLTPQKSSSIYGERQTNWTPTTVTDWQLQVSSFSLYVDALLRFPGNVGQPLEWTFQTSAIRPGGVEIMVVSVLLKFLHNKQKGKHTLRDAVM